MQEVRRLAGLIGKTDIVVGDWDTVSDLYGAIWASDGQVFEFPTEAVLYGNGATTRLRDLISTTKRKGGRVYFLALLDEPKQTWNYFLGTKCGVSYSEMELYRMHSVIRARFRTRYSELSLREFDLASFD